MTLLLLLLLLYLIINNLYYFIKLIIIFQNINWTLKSHLSTDAAAYILLILLPIISSPLAAHQDITLLGGSSAVLFYEFIDIKNTFFTNISFT